MSNPTTTRADDLARQMDEIGEKIEEQLRPTLLILVVGYRGVRYMPAILDAPRHIQMAAASRHPDFAALLREMDTTNLAWNIAEGLY